MRAMFQSLTFCGLFFIGSVLAQPPDMPSAEKPFDIQIVCPTGGATAGSIDSNAATVKDRDPIELDASATQADSWLWHQCDGHNDRVRYDDPKGKQRLFFWAPGPGKYEFNLTVARVTEAGEIEQASQVFTVTVTPTDAGGGGNGGGGGPTDPDPPDPSPLGLRDHVTRSVMETVSGATRRLEALAHAELYRAVAARMKTSMNSRGDIATIADVQAAQLNVNTEYRGSLAADRKQQWSEYLQVGGPLAERLNALAKAGKLDTIDEVHAAWLEIVDGLERVR